MTKLTIQERWRRDVGFGSMPEEKGRVVVPPYVRADGVRVGGYSYEREGGVDIGITPALHGAQSFDGAARLFDDPEFAKRAAAFEADARRLPGGVTIQRQVGMWEGEWEPSYEIHVDSTGPEVNRAAFDLGDRYQQYGVAAFSHGPEGDDVEVEFSGEGVPQLERALKSAGILGASFSDRKHAKVMVRNDAEGADQLQRLVEHLDENGMEYTYGYGTFALHENQPQRDSGKGRSWEAQAEDGHHDPDPRAQAAPEAGELGRAYWDGLASSPDGRALHSRLRESPSVKALAADEVEEVRGDELMRKHLLTGRELFARAFEQAAGETNLDGLHWDADEWVAIEPELEVLTKYRVVVPPYVRADGQRVEGYSYERGGGRAGDGGGGAVAGGELPKTPKIGMVIVSSEGYRWRVTHAYGTPESMQVDLENAGGPVPEARHLNGLDWNGLREGGAFRMAEGGDQTPVGQDTGTPQLMSKPLPAQPRVDMVVQSPEGLTYLVVRTTGVADHHVDLVRHGDKPLLNQPWDQLDQNGWREAVGVKPGQVAGPSDFPAGDSDVAVPSALKPKLTEAPLGTPRVGDILQSPRSHLNYRVTSVTGNSEDGLTVALVSVDNAMARLEMSLGNLQVAGWRKVESPETEGDKPQMPEVGETPVEGTFVRAPNGGIMRIERAWVDAQGIQWATLRLADGSTLDYKWSVLQANHWHEASGDDVDQFKRERDRALGAPVEPSPVRAEPRLRDEQLVRPRPLTSKPRIGDVLQSPITGTNYRVTRLEVARGTYRLQVVGQPQAYVDLTYEQLTAGNWLKVEAVRPGAPDGATPSARPGLQSELRDLPDKPKRGMVLQGPDGRLWRVIHSRGGSVVELRSGDDRNPDQDWSDLRDRGFRLYANPPGGRKPNVIADEVAPARTTQGPVPLTTPVQQNVPGLTQRGPIARDDMRRALDAMTLGENRTIGGIHVRRTLDGWQVDDDTGQPVEWNTADTAADELDRRLNAGATRVSPEQQKIDREMQTSDVSDVDYFGGGGRHTNDTYQGTLDDGTEVVLKPRFDGKEYEYQHGQPIREQIDGEHGLEHSEATERLADFFGVPTPRVTTRHTDDLPEFREFSGFEGDVGIQQKVPGYQDAGDGASPDFTRQEAEQWAVLDAVVANTDRHDGNWGVDGDGAAVAIDQDLTFPNTSEKGWGNAIHWYDEQGNELEGTPLSDTTMDMLRRLKADQKAWSDNLKGKDGLTQTELDLMWERVDHILETRAFPSPTDYLEDYYNDWPRAINGADAPGGYVF